MNKKYEISLHSRNGNYNSETFKDIKLNVYEYEHDIDIKSFSFTSGITNEKYSDEINWCINYLLLEIYNGVRILCGLKTFIPHEQNSQLKTLSNHIAAYEIINSSCINLGAPNKRDNEFRRVMRTVMYSKTLRDLCILLDRVHRFDENSLINFYKIKDFVKSYKDLFKKYNGEYKSEIEELTSVYSKLNKYNQLVNSYLTIGLAARHGLANQAPTKNKFDQDEIEQLSIDAIQKVINISKRNVEFNFDILLIKYQIKNKS